jgi:acetyl/propionyl-CoA carboxylase alpha subunit
MAPRSLHALLVANRGEIARRVIRGAHDAGLEAVAVFAADDAQSPHVAEADLAVPLPGTTLAETYLNPHALIAAARVSGADAVHPGYGFLSENPAFAEGCEEAGLTWVGPTPESMRTMGHKAVAKATVSAAGVPVLPSAVPDGSASDAELLEAAASIGFPLLVKASAGGGGRGMRQVNVVEELIDAVAAARREAAAAFGSDEVFFERFLRSPRHIEVQVIGDEAGHVLHLFDRECSVQRRHQKVAGGGGGRPLGGVPRGRDGRVPRRRYRFLLPRDEHPPAGGARGDRAGHRAGPGGTPVGRGGR